MKENEVRNRILAVSRQLFIDKGYSGTSIRDIASNAEVNVAMVNYYFKSKHNLFEIILNDASNVLLSKIFAIIQSDLPFNELIENWVNSYYEVLMENQQLPMFVLNEINQRPEHLIENLGKHKFSQVIKVITRRVNSEIEKGTIKDISVISLFLSVISLCVFPFMVGGVLTITTGDKSKEYYDMLENHKKFVVKFIIDAIKSDKVVN